MVFLPHKHLQPDAWAEAAAALLPRTELWGSAEHAPRAGDTDGATGARAADGATGSGGGAFAGVPADGLLAYARTLWSQIQTQAPLHLPSLKALLAEHRCAQLAEAEAARARARVPALRRKLRRILHDAHGAGAGAAAGAAGAAPASVVSTGAELTRSARAFRRRCERFLSVALQAYDVGAARYGGVSGGECVAKHRHALCVEQWAVIRPLAARHLSGISSVCAAGFAEALRRGEFDKMEVDAAEVDKMEVDAAEVYDDTAFGGGSDSGESREGGVGDGSAGPHSGGSGEEVDRIGRLRKRVLTSFGSAAAASSPRQARLGRASGWTVAVTDERHRLRTSLQHATDVWRVDQEAASLRFELGIARAAEAHARSLLTGSARAGVARVVLLFFVVLRLVTLLRHPILPLICLGVSYYAAPQTTRAVLSFAGRRSASLVRSGLAQVASALTEGGGRADEALGGVAGAAPPISRQQSSANEEQQTGARGLLEPGGGGGLGGGGSVGLAQCAGETGRQPPARRRPQAGRPRVVTKTSKSGRRGKG